MASPAAGSLAARLAAGVGGTVRELEAGSVVWCQSPARPIPLDRERLATLPGMPTADVPLVCLDTETTGLATAAGTLAFLVGVGWWVGDALTQVQLLVPDHADERAMLDTLETMIPPTSWLVTYNGRAFDWPLLVARYRLHGAPAPAHAGHLDLLPLVRRLFRHRLVDARLASVESGLLGIHRHGDVGGWEIPGRFLRFLDGAPAEPLAEVVRHNDQDVRSLAHLLGLLSRGLADRATWSSQHPGDLAGLSRALARGSRFDDALACLEIASLMDIPSASGRPTASHEAGLEAWWQPRHRPDFGARVLDRDRPTRVPAGGPWTSERIAIERARLQRRSGDIVAAARSWSELARGSGRVSIVAGIELAKILEHRMRDPDGALRVVMTASGIADRRRRLGRPEPGLERDLRHRAERLRRRLGTGSRRAPQSSIGPAPTV